MSISAHVSIALCCFKDNAQSLKRPLTNGSVHHSPEDPQISPTAPVPPSFSNASPDGPSRDKRRVSDFGNYRRDLAVLASSGIPSISHNPPTALGSPNQVAPWMSANGALASPSSAFGTSFYNDSSENLSQASQLSPAFRPGSVIANTTASDSPADPYFGDERRPSIASITTASSQGSRSSVSRTAGLHKKLHTFFGDDFPGRDGSETSLPSQGKEVRSHSFGRSQRERQNSNATDIVPRDASPGASRPRTPVPSSDVVPFLYQDSTVNTQTSSS